MSKPRVWLINTHSEHATQDYDQDYLELDGSIEVVDKLSYDQVIKELDEIREQSKRRKHQHHAAMSELTKWKSWAREALKFLETCSSNTVEEVDASIDLIQKFPGGEDG